ncbi:hypothetical protein V8E52_004444 [Russula decolorans]
MLSATSPRATLGQVENRRGAGRVSMERRCRCGPHLLSLSLSPNATFSSPRGPEARPAPKPQPIGSFPFILLLTTATVCVLFVIWRRSDTLRTVVAHQLKTWTRQEGAVRLSEDDGPPAHLFLEDDEDEEDEVGDVDDIGDIGENASHFPSPVELQSVGITRVDVTGHEDVPPAPPPKDRT